MCGISVVVDYRDRQIDPDLVKSVNDKVTHRGPDDEGFFYGDNFAFGHRRLSILDLSQAGHQPMQRENLCITYNGEIYNYLELRDELKLLGNTFISETDTEVILAAYRQWGTEAFKKFNGMWAFAIADETKNEVIFCRDHFGIKPLYYTTVQNYFLAGSEIKQFTVVPGFIPVLNKSVAVNFLTAGLLNYSEQTFFEGVNELKAGNFLTYNLVTHQFQVLPWYDLQMASISVQENSETAVEKVRSLFLESVKVRMRSDVRVGSCLSGGIDSSSIVSVIASQRMANQDFATITSCYKDSRYDEQKFSDLVTKQTGFQAAKVYPELNDLLDKGILDVMLYHQDQPFSTASHFSEYKVFEKAKEERLIVMQDGQGSDEYLCGYGEFFDTRIIELISAFKWTEAISLIRQKAAHKKVSFFSEAKRMLHSRLTVRVIHALKKIAGKPQYPWLTDNWQRLAVKSNLQWRANTIRDLSIAEICQTSIPYQLHSEDRNSMLFSIESRLPFLDHRLVEYCIGLDSSHKIWNGYSKYVLREAINELPEAIKFRKDKMGFVAPDREWILQNKERVRDDLITISKVAGVFTEELVNRFDKFVEGKLGYEPIYFRAMTFSRFCKIFNMKIS